MRKTKVFGFSLLEITVVLAIIIGLLVTIVPLARDFWSKNKIDVRVSTILNALKFAQNQALLKHKNVVLSEISDDTGWSSGMRLFVDEDENHRFDDNDILIREWHWRKSLPLVKWHGFNSDHYLVFTPDLSRGTLSGRFVISIYEQHIEKGKKIIVNRLGRARVETL
jgi:Tfp pilus assembly protein FimT